MCGLEGGKKHEIYAAAFGGHLFMTNFYTAGGGGAAWPPLPPPPGSATDSINNPSDCTTLAIPNLRQLIFNQQGKY